MPFRRLAVAFVAVSLALGLALCGAPARGAEAHDPVPDFPEQILTTAPVSIANGPRNTLNVAVTSWRDIPFQTVKRQALDYSCGSAAVATLLTYVYGQPVSEAEVFRAMFAAGDQASIRRAGFSMLDIRSYLAQRGLKAEGFRLSLDEVERKRVPFIALLEQRGYHHFVLVKSIRRDSVLVGDPVRGNAVMRRGEFLGKWNGIALIVTNQARRARALFGDEAEWRMARTLSYPSARAVVPGVEALRPDATRWQMDRAGPDMLEVTLFTNQQVQAVVPSITPSITTAGGLTGAVSGAGGVP